MGEGLSLPRWVCRQDELASCILLEFNDACVTVTVEAQLRSHLIRVSLSPGPLSKTYLSLSVVL